MFSLLDLLWWLFGAGLFGLTLMGIDKAAAKWGNKRISERNLWLVALVGGFAGIVLGGFLFHHKIRKPTFWGPIILATIVWILLFALIVTGFLRL
jgi:uncharacterized membrane protein YsdA (DUF1294 family)